MNQIVQDLYEGDDFEGMIENARMNAANEWEESFVADMKERFAMYGKRMFLSDAQRDKLERIASDE